MTEQKFGLSSDNAKKIGMSSDIESIFMRVKAVDTKYGWSTKEAILKFG